jgi:4-hydroxy-tetrahydrodipicolinate synthase
MNKELALNGVIPSIATPLTDDGGVDERSLRRLVRHLLRAGVHGIFANGTMGGFTFLNNDDQVRAISIIADEVGDVVPVIGNVAETSTRRALHLFRDVANCGVRCVSFLTPFYLRADQSHLISFYTEVAAACELPVFLYDNPALTKNEITPETVVALTTNVQRIIGMKESTPDDSKLKKLVDLSRKAAQSFSVFSGNERLMLRGLELGCAGSIGGLYNICPSLAVALYTNYGDGNLDTARKLQCDLNQVWGLFEYGNVWGGFDEALRYLGLAERVSGSPYVSKLTPAEAEQIHVILDRFVRPSNQD